MNKNSNIFGITLPLTTDIEDAMLAAGENLKHRSTHASSRKSHGKSSGYTDLEGPREEPVESSVFS